uniref:vWA domain-containing protein n=1 Tax=Ningiella ruwaisensis TaxID=2364274 RepID=UPI00109FB17B|nr:VWA domain-containing protein [Ningiella ruwaisensis]
MFEFVWPYVFIILPLPFIVRAFLPAKRVAKSAALRVPSIASFQQNTSQTQAKGRGFVLVSYLIWALLVSAAARPQWLGEAIAIPSEGRDLMIAVDLSGSMKQADMQIQGREVNRLTMIKYVLADFIERRVGDRLGLILFADTAYLQAPLTFDRDTVQTLLDEAVIGLVGERTAIGDAIGLAVKRFSEKQESNRVLVLLTDGQNTAGNISPDQALELAKANKVTVYTIGVGADEQIISSFFGTQRSINPSQDLDERMLSNIARETGGQYFRARDTQDLVNIYQLLDQLEPVEGNIQKMRPQSALFYYPLAAACLLVLLSLIAATVRPFISVKMAKNDGSRDALKAKEDKPYA